MEKEFDLVEVLQDNRVMTTSLKIAEVFGKEHKNVMAKIKEKITLFNGLDYKLVNYVDAKGENRPMYLLDRDFTSFIIMGFTGAKSDEWKLKYIQAFNAMEEQLKNQNKSQLPCTYKDALIQLLEQVEQNEKLLEENKVLVPKAEYHDNVLNKEDLITTTVVAKDLGMSSASKLNALLFTQRILYKDKSGTWIPYAEYEWLINEKYCDYQSYDKPNAHPTLKWTELGRKWIIDNYDKWLAKEEKKIK